jgi:hypothetical protein
LVKLSNKSSLKNTVLKYSANISSDSFFYAMYFNTYTVSSFTDYSYSTFINKTLRFSYVLSYFNTCSIKSVPNTFDSSMNLGSCKIFLSRMTPAS